MAAEAVTNPCCASCFRCPRNCPRRRILVCACCVRGSVWYACMLTCRVSGFPRLCARAYSERKYLRVIRWHMYTHTHTHTCTHAHMHTHTNMHTYIHTHTHTYIHTYKHTYTHIHTHTHTHTHVCVRRKRLSGAAYPHPILHIRGPAPCRGLYICICICICMCMCICIYCICIVYVLWQ